jgi:putative lysine transport system ATP-binding protein
MEAILNIKNLSKSFDNVEILKNISIDIFPKDVLVIIGPSGSGKSTLLRCINFLEYPDAGQIIFKGEEQHIASKSINNYRSKVGFVFQSFNLFANLNVIDNCTLGLIQILKQPKDKAIEEAKFWLNKVGMGDFIYRDPNSLSGGQKQRVAIARTLCMHPDLILFDEPTSALDPEMVGDVLNVIKELTTLNITMVIVTHEIKFAKEVASRSIFMADGEIVEQTDGNTLFIDPKVQRTKTFLERYL